MTSIFTKETYSRALVMVSHDVGIYCQFITDWIEFTRAQILFPRQMQNRDIEPNSKYYLEEYFNKS